MKKEIEMSLEEIKYNFGNKISNKCENMYNGEFRIFRTAICEAITIRCKKINEFERKYYINGKNTFERLCIWIDEWLI